MLLIRQGDVYWRLHYLIRCWNRSKIIIYSAPFKKGPTYSFLSAFFTNSSKFLPVSWNFSTACQDSLQHDAKTTVITVL